MAEYRVEQKNDKPRHITADGSDEASKKSKKDDKDIVEDHGMKMNRESILGIAMICLFVVVFYFFAMGQIARAGGQTYTTTPGGPSNIINLQPRFGAGTATRDQEIRWGKRDRDPKRTLCRLAGRKIVRTKKICVYKGAQNTTENAVVEKWDECPKEYWCKYEPNNKAISIYDVFESLEDAIK